MNLFSIFSSKKTESFDSGVNRNIRVVAYGNRKVIYVDGAEQTGGTITGMWRKSLLKVKKGVADSGNALLLGLAGGDVVRILRGINPGLKLTAIDLDPVMIRIAGDYYGLKGSSNLKIYRRDALNFLLLNRKKFDLIVVDLFIGFKNPEKFRTARFLGRLKDSLAPRGFIVYNSHYHFDSENEFGEFFGICNRVFSEARILLSYPYSRILALKP